MNLPRRSASGWPSLGIPTSPSREWWRRLAHSGYGFPHWPTEWFGKSMSTLEAAAVRKEMASARVLGPPIGVGTSMAAPVLIAHGSEDQRARWLPALAVGEERWCQFFSEPDAGSDLASIRTQAVSDGNGWLVKWTKGLELRDTDGRPGDSSGQDRSGPPKAPRFVILRHRYRPARDRGEADPADERANRVQRDLLQPGTGRD